MSYAWKYWKTCGWNVLMTADEIISYYSIRTYVDGEWKHIIYRRIERPALIVNKLFCVDTEQIANNVIEELEKENDTA